VKYTVLRRSVPESIPPRASLHLTVLCITQLSGPSVLLGRAYSTLEVLSCFGGRPEGIIDN
jgi:hypothetical protein